MCVCVCVCVGVVEIPTHAALHMRTYVVALYSKCN